MQHYAGAKVLTVSLVAEVDGSWPDGDNQRDHAAFGGHLQGVLALSHSPAANGRLRWPFRHSGTGAWRHIELYASKVAVNPFVPGGAANTGWNIIPFQYSALVLPSVPKIGSSAFGAVSWYRYADSSAEPNSFRIEICVPAGNKSVFASQASNFP